MAINLSIAVQQHTHSSPTFRDQFQEQLPVCDHNIIAQQEYLNNRLFKFLITILLLLNKSSYLILFCLGNQVEHTLQQPHPQESTAPFVLPEDPQPLPRLLVPVAQLCVISLLIHVDHNYCN